MKKRVIKISAIVVGILIVGWFGIYILLPRIMLYKMVKDYLPSIDKSAEYFTDFNISNNDVQTIDNGYISVKIPSNYNQDTRNLEILPFMYRNPDKDESVMLLEKFSDLSDLNFLDPEKYGNIDGVSKDMGVNEIKSGFKSVGKGLPDSAYNTYKIVLLLNKDDYSFWNFKKGTCFLTAAVMKEILCSNYDEMYLYEKDNIRGTIMIKNGENKYDVVFSFYDVNDLNKAYDILIIAKNLDDVYAVINSAEFI